jgi:hypothetical protein
MSIRALIALSILTVAVAGCKSGDATTSNTPATPPATTGGATPAADTTTTTGDAATTGGATADASNPLIGTWQASPEGHVLNVEFKADSFTISADVKDEAKKMDISASQEGTYKIDGDKVTFHYTSQKATANNDASKEMADAMNKQPVQPDETDTIKADGKDKVTLTDEKGKKKELTRKS